MVVLVFGSYFFVNIYDTRWAFALQNLFIIFSRNVWPQIKQHSTYVLKLYIQNLLCLSFCFFALFMDSVSLTSCTSSSQISPKALTIRVAVPTFKKNTRIRIWIRCSRKIRIRILILTLNLPFTFFFRHKSHN